MTHPRTIASGFAFPEGPRWHDGKLWFSDQHDGFVTILDPTGTVEERFAVPGGPSGMGWMPDGTLLVVSMHERRLYRRSADKRLVVHAELADFHPGHSNDMVVDRHGRAYVGNIGFDFDAGEAPRQTCIVAVAPDGKAEIAADGIDCPNGTVIAADGRTLIVAESMGHRLSRFDIDETGRLSNRRLFADLGDHVPDGICLDAEGAVWVASPYARAVIRVRPGGEIAERIVIADANPYACMLGDADGRTLFICCAPAHDPLATVETRMGRIDAVRVTAPSAGGRP